MIATYNTNVGDVLLLILADKEGQALDFKREGQVSRVFREDGKTVAWNIFEAKSILPSLGENENGPVKLSEADIDVLNKLMTEAGFSDEPLVYEAKSKFVVAEVVEMEDHPDSDHLHICQVNIGEEKTVQIVCGAPNARLGMKSIAALPGAMMPDGKLIFQGELRGVASFGMMCSPRELQVPNAPDVRGVIEIADQFAAGADFDVETMWQA